MAQVNRDVVSQEEQDRLCRLVESGDDDDEHEELSIHHWMPSALENLDWNDLTASLKHVDFDTMNAQQRDEARRAIPLMLLIREQLTKKKLILRAAYRGNTFHLFTQRYFQHKASKYMRKMQVDSRVRKLTGRCPERTTQRCLLQIVDRVETTFDQMHQKLCLNAVQRAVMDVRRRQVQLNYLYFVPDTTQVCV
jgi:hypothetical protein